MSKLKKYLSEVKATSIKKGQSFTLSGDIGKFNKGEKVTVYKIIPFGDDIELHLQNDKGTKDTFYLDKNDTFDSLS